MANIYEISSNNWQMALNQFGSIVEGLADIKQCIALILTTSRGSDPFRPDFGTDIYKLIDKPINIVAPTIISQILEGVELWESRVKVKQIKYNIDGEKLNIDTTLQIIASGQSTNLLLAFEKYTTDVQSTVPAQPTNRAFGNGFSLGFS